jgi:hypothetical protein
MATTTESSAKPDEVPRLNPVLWRAQLVVGRPQRVIVWRLRPDEATVELLCPGGAEQPTHNELRAARSQHLSRTLRCT